MVIIIERKVGGKNEKTKNLLIVLFLSFVLLIIPNICKAMEITVTRNVYSNNGSMKFTFEGLTLDKTHEYEFGLTATQSAEVETWHLITDFTENSAVVDIVSSTKDLRQVIDTTDNGYISIKDKTENKDVVKGQKVDLKMPFLQVSNYTVVSNGKVFDDFTGKNFEIPIRNGYRNTKAYYQYEKITDENVIKKYQQIENESGDILGLENLLKKDAPVANWSSWQYWNNYPYLNCPVREVSVPDSGLYYMWLYVSGDNLKDVYGCILVDNLQPNIAIESISLPQTAKVELGKTLTLTPKFNPTNATNKIVTWSSSDETVVTVDNGGKITPKKLGSTVITVVSEDGNKKASCTVTVVEASNNNGGSGSSNNGNTNNGNSNNKPGKDNTVAPTGKLPFAGAGIGITFIVIALIGGAIYAYMRYKNLKGI